MGSAVFKAFAESASVAGLRLIDNLDQEAREGVNSALAVGASVSVSVSFDARGLSTIRLELLTGEDRHCLASLTEQAPAIQ